MESAAQRNMEEHLSCLSLLPILRMAGQEEDDGITKRCNRGQRRRATVAKMAEVDSRKYRGWTANSRPRVVIVRKVRYEVSAESWEVDKNKKKSG